MSLNLIAEQTAIASDYTSIVQNIVANAGAIQSNVLQRLSQLELLLTRVNDSIVLSEDDKASYSADIKDVITNLKNQVTAVGTAVTAEADRILAL